MSNEPPKSVRIRTKGENAYRFDAIERASAFYDQNKSDAVAYACDDVVRIANALEECLAEIDSIETREAVAERLDRAASFDVDVDHAVEIGTEE